jgi:hypothetical protein
MKDTKVTCHCGEKITPGENLIYCSTLQLAWNELCDFMGSPGASITFQGNLEPATLLAVQELNKRLATKNDLDPNSYMALAGYVQEGPDGIVNRIAKELREKFNETSKVDFSSMKPMDIVAYAFLLKVLEFEHKFEEIKNFRFQGNAVKAFGLDKHGDGSHPGIGVGARQVRVLHYKNPSEFTLSINTKSGGIITLARLQPGLTLQDTIGAMKMDSSETLEEGEIIKIPKISFDLEQHFSELAGPYLNIARRGEEPTSTGYYISDAVQLIKFDLNEEGAKLRSEAAIMCKRCVSFAPKNLRQFIFDGPFLVLLRQSKETGPYFAAWVENTEILVKEN